jgi:hypothetical protein
VCGSFGRTLQLRRTALPAGTFQDEVASAFEAVAMVLKPLSGPFAVVVMMGEGHEGKSYELAIDEANRCPT